MVDENKVEGFARDIGGKLQDAAGGLTGDSGTQVRGKINQAAGQAQSMYGDVVDEVRDFTADQPLGALLAAVGVGVVIGFLLARN
ncbi:MAG: CsbD family protein [Pseudomonadota bacterium]|nr:CsbD family protein [Pseudomonadota bacterium]